jgi:NADPH-dependent 2,4-dienoyl-CoA reductase/sulfur reductase-like enzyme
MQASRSGDLGFEFEGRAIPIADGATIAAALTAAGELALKHSRQGDSRGIFCGMGVCQECLVSIDGNPAQRACMTPAHPGTRVSRAPALVRLTPPTAAPEDPSEPGDHRAAALEERRHCDLLVVGGGPGGLSAAALAAEAGLDVVLIDERPKLGGQYFKQPAASTSRAPADAQFAAGRALIERTRAAGVELHSGTSVWGAFGLDAICAVAGRQRWRLSCEALILAPGAYERGLPFPGWTLPGVMTTGAAQTLWRSYGVSPGTRVLISGNGPLNMQVAAELTAGGATVVGLAELAPPPLPARLGALARMARADPALIRDGLRYRTVLARARVPVMYGSVVTRVEGEGKAQSAVVSAVDSAGRPRGRERRFEVDAVCLGLGFIPSTEIARSLGCRHEYRDELGQLVTVVNDRGATSVENVWVVGDGAGIRGARHAQAQGELAAFDVARSSGRDVPAPLAERRRHAMAAAARHSRFQRALAQVFSAPHLNDQLADAETHICRCEGVSRQAVEAAIADGAGHAGAIKRRTRAGMGPCQGRYCGPVLAAMIARGTGERPDEFSGFAPSPPAKPLEIGALLGLRD